MADLDDLTFDDTDTDTKPLTDRVDVIILTENPDRNRYAARHADTNMTIRGNTKHDALRRLADALARVDTDTDIHR